MSGELNLLVTAHSELYIHYWDLNNVAKNDFNPVEVIMSPLKCQTTGISVFPKANGFAVVSIEGRCGIKYLEFNGHKPNTKLASQI